MVVPLVGEASVKEANAARFRQTAEREFQAFRKERLATGELECQKLISAAQSPPHAGMRRPSPSCDNIDSRGCM